MHSTESCIWLLLREEFNFRLGLYQLVMGAGKNLGLEQGEYYLTGGLIIYMRVNGVNTRASLT